MEYNWRSKVLDTIWRDILVDYIVKLNSTLVNLGPALAQPIHPPSACFQSKLAWCALRIYIYIYIWERYTGSRLHYKNSYIDDSSPILTRLPPTHQSLSSCFQFKFSSDLLRIYQENVWSKYDTLLVRYSNSMHCETSYQSKKQYSCHPSVSPPPP